MTTTFEETQNLPTVTQAKDLAKSISAEAVEISYAQALERVAHQHGYRDWNTFSAAIDGVAPAGWEVGGRVQGEYLSHPFNATVKTIKMLRPGWFKLSLELDEAIDVIRSEDLSNFRKRIQGVVGPKGTSVEKTSNGAPLLVILM